MRRTLAALASAAALTLTACGGGSDSSPAGLSSASNSDTAASSPATSASATSKRRVAPKLDYGTSAAEVAAAAGCTGMIPKPASPNDIEIGPAAVEDVFCTLDGDPVEINTYANEADMQAVLAIVKSFAAQYGGFVTAVGDGWSANLEATEGQGTPDLDRQRALAEKIAARCGGEVLTVDAA